jgi:hypothetical protein
MAMRTTSRGNWTMYSPLERKHDQDGKQEKDQQKGADSRNEFALRTMRGLWSSVRCSAFLGKGLEHGRCARAGLFHVRKADTAKPSRRSRAESGRMDRFNSFTPAPGKGTRTCMGLFLHRVRMPPDLPFHLLRCGGTGTIPA